MSMSDSKAKKCMRGQPNLAMQVRENRNGSMPSYRIVRDEGHARPGTDAAV